MIKVLMIGNHPTNKGGMTSVINQIRNYNWDNEAVKMSFIATFIPGNGFKKTVFFAGAYLRILANFVFNRPDIVHMHMSYKGSFTRKYCVHRLCKIFGIKDIIHLHGSEFEKWYKNVNEHQKSKIRRLFSETDRVIVLGEEWKNIVKKIEPSAKISIISNGIEIPEKIVNWNNERCQIVFLGVLIPRKGVLDLIKAINQINLQGEMGILRFVIAGTGEEEEKIKTEVKNAGLENVVSFAGWVSGNTKKSLLEESQILVSPSYNEGLPVSILEAASYGMPIVSTNVGSISSVVKDKVNGILIEPGAINELVDGILYAASYSNFQRLSVESRNIIEKSFSIESFYKKLSDLYCSIGEMNG